MYKGQHEPQQQGGGGPGTCAIVGWVIGGLVALLLVILAVFLLVRSTCAPPQPQPQYENFGITGVDPGAPTNTIQLNQPFSAIPIQPGYAAPNVCGPHSMIPVGMQSGFNIPWYGGWKTPVPNLAGILREDDWEQRMYGVLRNRSIPIQDANPASAAGLASGCPRRAAAVDAAPVAGQVNLQYHLSDGQLSTPAVPPFASTNTGPSLADLMAAGGALSGDRDGNGSGSDDAMDGCNREGFRGGCAANKQAVAKLVDNHESPEEKLKRAYHKLPASNMAQGVLDRAQTKALVTMVSRRSLPDQQRVRKSQLAAADWLRGDLHPAVENTWNVFRPLNADRDRDLRPGALGVLAAPGGPWCSTSPIPENMAVCHIDDHCGNNDTGGGGGRGASFVSPISP